MTNETSNENVQPEAPIESTTSETVVSESTDFLADIPEDLRAEPSLANIKDKTTLIKSYVSAQRMLGSSIRIPGPEASDEAKKEFLSKLSSVPGVVKLPETEAEMSEFFTKLGRPETPDGYKVDFGENIKIPDEVSSQFKQLAHKIGLNQQQADALVGFEKSMFEAKAYQEMERFNNTKAILQKEWGQDFENRLNASKELLQHFGNKFPDAVNDIANTSALGNNPVILMMMAELSKAYQESGVISGQSKTKFGLTPEEAMARINELKTNPQHAYFDHRSPKHMQTVKEIEELYNSAYPNKSVDK